MAQLAQLVLAHKVLLAVKVLRVQQADKARKAASRLERRAGRHRNQLVPKAPPVHRVPPVVKAQGAVGANGTDRSYRFAGRGLDCRVLTGCAATYGRHQWNQWRNWRNWCWRTRCCRWSRCSGRSSATRRSQGAAGSNVA